MKKKAIPPFTLTAGQSGRLICNFTLPEGTAAPALKGAVSVHGQRVNMELVAENELLIPVLPAGVYLAEVRASGQCVLYGHIEVLPSPLAAENDEALFRVDVDAVADVLTVNLTMLEGAPGPKGDQGEPGASAYALWLAAGNSGSEAEFVAQLNGEVTVYDEPLAAGAEDNYNAYGFGMVMQTAGTVVALETPCRSTAPAKPTDEPLLVKVWRKDSEGNKILLATSANYQTHAVGASLRWEFAGFTVAQGDVLLVTLHNADYAEGASFAAGWMGCFAVVPVTAAETGLLNAQGNWGSQGWVVKYRWVLKRRHAENATAHLNATEHAGLAELLTHKDELLALLV